MKQAQEIAKRYVLPWLRPEQEEAEQQYRRVSPRFVELGNDFLKRLAEGGIPELARMPHALDPEVGFRVRSTFTFADFIQVAQPVSPLRWLADVLLSFVGALFLIKKDGREFLVTLLESTAHVCRTTSYTAFKRATGIWRPRSESFCAKSAAWQSRLLAMREECGNKEHQRSKQHGED
jgi:hypothetical protein